MGKKKKDKKPKEKKHKSGVEERMKQVSNIQLPDENPFKMENERNIDFFMRRGRSFLGSKKKGKSIKDTKRMKHSKGK
jgi:hypothetical protein